MTLIYPYITPLYIYIDINTEQLSVGEAKVRQEPLTAGSHAIPRSITEAKPETRLWDSFNMLALDFDAMVRGMRQR